MSQHGESLPRFRPAILIVHGAAGLSSCCIESLADRLCAQTGNTCYVYNQLGNGLPNCDTLQYGVKDLQDVLEFLQEKLGEVEVHLVGHGFGGVVLMEALLRQELWGQAAPGLPSNLYLPKLQSICLMGTPSCTGILRSESNKLLKEAAKVAGRAEAESHFWQQHFSSGVPTLAEAYMTSTWQPWNHWVMRGWEIRREEVARRYVAATKGVPLLSVRGEKDFVTDRCVEAWRGVGDAIASARRSNASREQLGFFREELLSNCGHNAHLEDPKACASLIHDWLTSVEVSEDICA